MAGVPARSAILWVYLLSYALGAAASPAPQELFPRQSTVLLLAGLRGDIENEHASPLLAARFRPANGSFVLDKQTASSVSSTTLPNGSPLIELPACRESNEAPLHWRIEWTRVGDDKPAAHFHAQLLRGELSLAETVASQKQLRPLFAVLGMNASFASSP